MLLPEEQLGVVVLTNAMPVGIAEAISDQIIDRIVVGEDTQDSPKIWARRYVGLFSPDPSLAEAPDPAAPALSNDAYLGTYANDYYGTFEVIADGDGMALVEGPAKLSSLSPTGTPTRSRSSPTPSSRRSRRRWSSPSDPMDGHRP